MKRFSKTTKAAGLVEYGLLVGLISVLAIGSVLALGERVQGIFATTTNQIESASSDTALPEGGSPPESEPVEPDPEDTEPPHDPTHVSFDEAELRLTPFAPDRWRWPRVSVSGHWTMTRATSICEIWLGEDWTATEWTNVFDSTNRWAYWRASPPAWIQAGTASATESGYYLDSLTCFNPAAT